MDWQAISFSIITLSMLVLIYPLYKCTLGIIGCLTYPLRISRQLRMRKRVVYLIIISFCIGGAFVHACYMAMRMT